MNRSYSQPDLLINLSFLFSKPTGIATYAINLVPHLLELQPTLLTAQKFDGFSCYPTPANLTPQHGRTGQLRRLLWTQHQVPRIYHKLRSRLFFSPVPEAPLYANCRFVVMMHDLIPLRFPKRFSPLTNYFRYYLPLVLSQAEHIICNSTATARDITDFYSIRAAKITPIPLAYDAQHFRPSSPPLPLTPSPRPYFLYIGRHEAYKNLHRLICAFSSFNQDYQLWLAGTPDQRYTPQLQAQVQELGLSVRVKFLDYVPYAQLPTIISQATALVFPSLWEGFGLPALEAMACGTPVITSNLSSLPEVTGEAALLVNPYSTQEIAAAMKAVAEDHQLRSRLRTLSLQRASQFSWQRTGQATAQVLQQWLK